MTISKRRGLLPALALAAVGLMVAASTAGASHPRPAFGGKLTTNLVPAFDECTETTPPNRTHGPPLSGQSCNPPVKTSSALTIGGTMRGSIKLAVIEGVPGPPEDSDVKIIASIFDVRCDASTACTGSNTTGGPDYTGMLLGLATIRITDHWNGTGSTGGHDPATVSDLQFPVGAGCAHTSGDPSVGSTCGVTTSANAVVGSADPAARDGKRGVVEVSQIEVLDGGISGHTPTERFLVQGIFIP